MHGEHIDRYFEAHGAHQESAAHGERRTWMVLSINIVMMIAELIVGVMSGSLALLADGIHMATHVGALGLSAAAYFFARKWARHEAFSFGTGKMYALAGYTSAIVLAGAAVWMAVEAVLRLVHPGEVHFAEALPVAVIGLVVNLVSAKLLDHDHAHGDHAHDHDHDHDHHAHDHDHDHKLAHDHDHAHDDHAHDHDHDHARPEKTEASDHNLRAAYLHVVADALTSVLAILAILAGRYFGIVWLDAVMGIVGGAIVLKWSIGLARNAAKQLLDVSPSLVDTETIRRELEAIDDVQVADLHLWELGPGARGCIVKVVTSAPRDAAYYRDLIKARVDVSHLTVEVHRCTEEHA
ncbi:MAG: cation diffusion facilitator family transporter [Polyangiaceae bacterium]